jgi:hypothetical protein
MTIISNNRFHQRSFHTRTNGSDNTIDHKLLIKLLHESKNENRTIQQHFRDFTSSFAFPFIRTVHFYFAMKSTRKVPGGAVVGVCYLLWCFVLWTPLLGEGFQPRMPRNGLLLKRLTPLKAAMSVSPSPGVATQAYNSLSTKFEMKL